MIEIRVPKEILQYKEKLFFDLTLRQLLSILVAVVLGVPTYIVTNKYISGDLSGWFVILVAAVPILYGFWTYNGMPFEKLVEAVVTTMFIYPDKRVYETTNIYEYILFELKREDEENAKEARIRAKSEAKATGKKKNSKNSTADDTVHADL